MLYIIHKNQKDSKGTILATACQRFDFQTIPGKPSSAFVSSALPTRPRRRASSCFHQRYRTTHHDAKVAAHTTLLITFVHNKYLTFNTCNTLQHCIILVCPFCPFCPLSLSFFHSLDPSIWKCCLNESNECVLCPKLVHNVHIVWIRLGSCMSCSKENGTRKCGKESENIWEFWLDNLENWL